jgi:putative holliday junction resolvase
MGTFSTASLWTPPSHSSDRGVRVLGVDFGELRIGLALSDETGTLAFPHRALTRRRGKRPPLARIEEVARAEGVGALVFGLPLELSGAESPWSGEVRAAAEALGRRLSLPVHFVDERLSSVEAERGVRAAGLPRSAREERGRVDAAAAAVILQRWLDRREEES